MIEITEERHNELLHKEAELGALYGAGVTDWPGYEIAMDSISDD